MNTTTSTNVPTEQKPGLLINRNFALLWTGGSISVFGDLLFTTTLVVWITASLAAHQSWAPLAVSGVLLATLVPTLVVGPLAGVFVDRWNRRQTMLWMDALRAILIALLLLATTGVPLPFMPGGRLSLVGQLSTIYGCVFLTSLCSQFFGPARLALLGEIVPDPHRARASGLTQVARSLATIVAPPLAPILLLATGPQVALLINALSFAWSFLLLLAMRVPRTTPKPSADVQTGVLREFLAGLKMAVQSRVILTLLVALSVVLLGFSAFNALDIFFVLGNLHAPLRLFGFMETAQGVGAILGALLAGMFAQRIGLVRTLTGSLFLTGVGILIYSRMTSFAPALIVVFLCGFFLAALSVAAGPLLLRVTPAAYVGRVGAIIDPTGALMQVLGTLLAGALVSTLLLHFHAQVLGNTFGPIDTIFAGSAVLIMIGACFGLLRLGFSDPVSLVEAPPAEALTAPDVRTLFRRVGWPVGLAVVLLICELVFLVSGNYNELIILASVVVILLMTRFLPPKLPSENPLAKQSRATLSAPLWAIFGLLLVYGLVLVFVSLWVQAHPLSILPSLTYSHDLTWNVLAGDLPFFVVPTLLLTLRYGGTRQQLGLTQITRARWIGAGVTTLLLLALQLIGSGIRTLPVPAVAYTGLFSVIGIGFPEEFLFRVLLQTRLEVLLGRWNGLLVTTALFALGHMPGRVVSMWGKTNSPLLDLLLVFASVVTIQGPLALVLGYMWMRYRNAWLNVGAHALFDWFSYLTF